MSQCKSCGKELNAGSTFCESCGASQGNAAASGERHYNALRFIQGLYRVLAWIALFLVPVIMIINGTRMGGALGFFGGLLLGALFGALAWLFMMSVAEQISVLIDTAENTGKTVAAINALAQQLKNNSRQG